jgi:hypothetical protein
MSGAKPHQLCDMELPYIGQQAAETSTSQQVEQRKWRCRRQRGRLRAAIRVAGAVAVQSSGAETGGRGSMKLWLLGPVLLAQCPVRGRWALGDAIRLRLHHLHVRPVHALCIRRRGCAPIELLLYYDVKPSSSLCAAQHSHHTARRDTVVQPPRELRLALSQPGAPPHPRSSFPIHPSAHCNWHCSSSKLTSLTERVSILRTTRSSQDARQTPPSLAPGNLQSALVPT